LTSKHCTIALKYAGIICKLKYLQQPVQWQKLGLVDEGAKVIDLQAAPTAKLAIKLALDNILQSTACMTCYIVVNSELAQDWSRSCPTCLRKVQKNCGTGIGVLALACRVTPPRRDPRDEVMGDDPRTWPRAGSAWMVDTLGGAQVSVVPLADLEA